MKRYNTDSELLKLSKAEEGYILNPELEGGSFFWKNGETGVLLLHGLTATTAEVRPLAKSLLKEGYTVSGILLPGPVSYTHLTLPTIYSV